MRILKNFKFFVFRDVSKYSIADEDILVGDKYKIDLGMIIPDNGILINIYNLKVGESSLTGESNLMRKIF